jgi:hypothetical protein
MGEITETVRLYLEESDILEDKTEEISHTLETNIKDIIGPGQVGYDTGHLHDSVVSNSFVQFPVGIVIGWYGEDYGQYWYRWKGGVDFLQVGLEQTVALYR